MIPTCQPQEAQTVAAAGDAIILDVREAMEWAMGHIDGATLIPLNELPQRFTELPKDKRIICQCASGGRSASATRFLVEAGYDAHNMAGGIMQWRMSGLPVVR